MSQSLAEEQLMKSYFLGDLPEAQRERIRERLFSDEDFFEALQIVEGELVDEYVFGLTSKEEREKLERRLLIGPDEYQKVNLARTLNEYASSNKTVAVAHLEKVATPSIFTRLMSLFVRPSKVAQVSEKHDEDENAWENSLSEAHSNRNLIRSLMDDQWLGMELLLQLKAVRQATSHDLASLLKRDESSLVMTLASMSDCGLVHKLNGEYSCSETGEEVLGKLRSTI